MWAACRYECRNREGGLPPADYSRPSEIRVNKVEAPGQLREGADAAHVELEGGA
jgi:hypothetical protein